MRLKGCHEVADGQEGSWQVPNYDETETMVKMRKKTLRNRAENEQGVRGGSVPEEAKAQWNLHCKEQSHEEQLKDTGGRVPGGLSMNTQG